MVPRDAPILLLPVASFHDASGMYYQQQADFRFTQPGGYALRPDGATGVSYGPPDSPLVWLSALAGSGQTLFPQTALTAGTHQLASEQYHAIVVVGSAPSAAQFIALAQRLTGRRADRVVDGAHIWILRPKR